MGHLDDEGGGDSTVARSSSRKPPTLASQEPAFKQTFEPSIPNFQGERSDEELARAADLNARLIGESGAALPDRFLIFNVWDNIKSISFDQASDMGWGQAMYNNVMDTSMATVQSWIGTYLNNQRRLGLDVNTYFNSPEGFQELFELSWNRFASLNKDFGAFDTPTGGGRGSGRRGPSAQDIRNSFDQNALAQQATQIWRNMLYTAPPDANAMASAFVEAVVATGGEKQMDFVSFVRSKAMATGRFAVIYTDKPDGISPEAYLRQYTGPAEQFLRPGNVEGAALGGARLGSDQATFAARIRRSNETVTSAPFINSLETRIQNLSEVLRG